MKVTSCLVVVTPDNIRQVHEEDFQNVKVLGVSKSL